MDPLSDVLAILNPSSTLSSRFEGHGRWAFRFPGSESLIKFGGVLEGSFQLWVEDRNAPVTLQAGDFYLLTGGRPFVSASDVTVPIEDGLAAYRAGRGADGVVRHGRAIAGESRYVCLAGGRFSFDDEVGDLLLRQLPSLIHFQADDPASRPLAGLLDLMRWETSEARPGALIARAHLATLVLVQALRAYLNNATPAAGWLGAMADPRLRLALAALHRDLSERWTVETLAKSAGMSRTAFTTRFKRLIGETPLDYVTGWRMAVARHALRYSDDALADIAERIGYLSDTAFSAAFRRATGESPGSFRRSRRP